MAILLKKQRILSGLNLIGNFLERPLMVGDIVINDDGQHLIWGNLEDVIDGFSISGKTVTSNKSDVKYTTESNIIVTIGGSANSSVASGQVQLQFNKINSAFVVLKQCSTISIKLGLINDKLSEYWKQKGFDKITNRIKYHFINSILNAESGVVIFSEEKNNKVVLTGANNTPINSIGIIGKGDVEYVSNSKSTLEIISNSPIQPLYSAVRYKANGNFEVVG